MNNEFTIVIDTNEQKPFFSGRNAPKGIPIIRDNLKPHGGDYSILGYEDKFIVERKNPQDFLSSIFTEQFENTFPLLRSHKFRYIIVESSVHNILSMCNPTANKKHKKGNPLSAVKYKFESGAHPNSVKGKISSIISDHLIPIWFAEQGRKEAEFWVLDWIKKFHKAQMEGK